MREWLGDGAGRRALRAAVFAGSMLLALVLAGSARAQDDEPEEPPAATFTVLTRPANATVKLRGSTNIAGAGPLTIERPGAGRVRLSVSAPGFETWRRTLTLDGVGADSVWASLHRKSALKAAGRSLLVPGWGQAYDEHPAHAWTFGLAAATAGAGLLVSHLQFLDKQDIYEERLAKLRLPGQDTPSNRRIAQEAYEGAQDAHDTRDMFAAVGAGVWALNVLDALVFGPPRPRATPDTRPLGFHVAPDRATVAWSVRF